MKGLPAVESAVIEEHKLTRYLLADGHPAGRAKAAFFRRFGFRAEAAQQLRDALIDHARSSRVISMSETEFGTKYILEGPLQAVDGRRPSLRAIWFIPAGETAPRLVTAYPARGVRR
jgi:hypothetical protein